MSKISNEILDNYFLTHKDILIQQLSSLCLIDVGIIESVDKDGRATIQSFRFIQGEQLKYKKVELLLTGTRGIAINTGCVGNPCLLFVPRSCITNTSEYSFNPSAPSFSIEGIKAIPFSNGQNIATSVSFDNEGNMLYTTDTYTISLSPSDLSFCTENNILSMQISPEGDFFFTYDNKTSNNETHNMSLSFTKEGYVITYIQSDGSIFQKSIVPSTGVVLTHSKDNNNINSVTINNNGSIEIACTYENAEVNISIDTSGNVSINTSGNVEIEGNEIHLNGDSKRLVTYAELNEAMSKLWTALTTTPIIGNGSPQTTWTGITSINISASETQTVKTGG